MTTIRHLPILLAEMPLMCVLCINTHIYKAAAESRPKKMSCCVSIKLLFASHSVYNEYSSNAGVSHNARLSVEIYTIRAQSNVLEGLGVRIYTFI